MMKIGVVSDTHSKDVPPQLIKDFQKVDLIVHAGDFCSLEDYQFFQKIQEVKAVYGNVDEQRLCRKLPRRQVFEVEGVKIGVYHGEGSPHVVINFVKEEFKKDKVDVVIFGHSHYPFNEKIGKVLYFNPGSPNDIVRSPYCSYGILEIKSKNNIVAKIVKVDYCG
ncbi:Predicted phosphoesterase MJ0623 [hydrothermal vent metagenome]|uniref:Predicted phosphoesterase MJ0623 n=1 Tax=hydrothermal vent metagenome TaxID=652676 RepID=A0A3B1DZ46_9ZZZZ